jgi:radical SAM superfamily enzyme YgiQ (UPF0313 family)
MTTADLPINRHPVTIGLVQINNSFSGQNYLPYSVALLESYVKRYAEVPERFTFIDPVFRRMPVRDIVDRLVGTDLVGFSTYVWNAQISLETARRVKARSPRTLIVFGGPHVPDHPEAFLRANPFIDLAVHNEGERTFLKLVEGLPDTDWRRLEGVSFIDADGAFHKIANAPRIRDLDEVPSPFLDGTFDKLVASNPNETWIGLWETNRGCPFQCTFCDWGSATAGKVTKFEEDRLFKEVDWFARNKIEFIFCCDANFGIQKRDVEIAERVAAVKKQTGYPRALSVQNTKNATERAYLTQKILSDAGLNKGVALSMQSVDALTLKNIKRDNIALDTYFELQRRFTKDRVETYSDLILGLPGETYDSFAAGVGQLIEAGQHNRIQFNNLSILPNAEMGDPAYLEKFGIETVPSKIINIHGQRIEFDDDPEEIQDLVICTASTPRSEWRRTRAFAWMAALLYFDKLAQIPFIIAHTLTGVGYRELIEAFMVVDAAEYPLLAEIRDFFLDEAASIQNGGPEYVFSEDWLGIYWPADEYVFIKLTAEGKLDGFYDEVGVLLRRMLSGHWTDTMDAALTDALTLNRALIKQPNTSADVTITTKFDILSFYQAVLVGETVPLREVTTVTLIDRSTDVWTDFQVWCREVVWWGNKKGAYLYRNRVLEEQLAGHY